MSTREACVIVILAGALLHARAEETAFDPSASAEEILDALLMADDERRIPDAWQSELSLRLGGGHARNVLYSPFDEQDSVFSSSEAEFFATRDISTSPHHLHLYGYGSHRYYVDLDHDNNEAAAIVQGGWDYRGSRRGAAGIRATYFFVDQFLDTSLSDAEIESTRLTEHDLGLNPYATWSPTPFLSARIGGAYKLALLEESDDDYRQTEGSASLTGATPKGLSLTAQYRFQRDDYVSRDRRNALGETLPGSPVNIRNHDLRLEGAWHWDTPHRWRSTWWLSRRCRDDDEGDYYDYDSTQGGTGLHMHLDTWDADLGVSYGKTRYDERLASDDDGAERLRRWRWSAWCRLEKRLNRRWSVFADARWEDNDANNRLDVYRHASGLLGLGYAFTTAP